MSSFQGHVGPLDPLLIGSLGLGRDKFVHQFNVAVPLVFCFLATHDIEPLLARVVIGSGIHDMVSAERNIIL